MIDPQNPLGNAEYFTKLYMYNALERLESQQKDAARTGEALGKLRSALSTFQTALSGLGSAGGVVKYQGVLSNAALGSVSVGAGAQPGSYAFFVEQVATAHQLKVGGLPAVPVDEAGTLTLELGDGTTIDVDLSGAKPDADGNLSPAELARAINEASGNSGKVSASVVTINGEQQLVLTSGATGKDGEITINTSGIGHAELRDALGDAEEMIAAQNAVFRIGGKDSTPIEQSSNTFTGIQGVSVTFTRAMSEGDPELLLTVTRDGSSTQDNVKSFVDAYNALKKVLDDLTYAGNGTPGSAGPMAGDAGVRALQQRLNDVLRTSVDNASLLQFGISADRNGVLSLDGSKFNDALAVDPTALDKLFGDGKSGLTGKLDDYLKTWLSATDGQLKSRQESVDKIQDSLSKRESSLEAQYTRVYERYLAQFARLQMIDSQMNYTKDLLDALLTDNSKKK